MTVTLASVSLVSSSCCWGELDTTKDYYWDCEHPEFQVRILNDQVERVPWAKVPEVQRYFLADKPKRIRVPIVRVECTSLDAEGRPVPLKNAYRYCCEDVGLNPDHRRHSIGGSAH